MSATPCWSLSEREKSRRERLGEVYEYIVNCALENGYYPSTDELAKEFCFSKSTIFYRIKALEESGLVEKFTPKHSERQRFKPVGFSIYRDSDVILKKDEDDLK